MSQSYSGDKRIEKNLKIKAAFLAILIHFLFFFIPFQPPKLQLHSGLDSTVLVFDLQKGVSDVQAIAKQKMIHTDSKQSINSVNKRPFSEKEKSGVARILESQKSTQGMKIRSDSKSDKASLSGKNSPTASGGVEEGLPGDRATAQVMGTINPTYPKTALNHEWQGTVEVDVVINENGKMMSFEVAKSSGYSILDESLIKSLKDKTLYLPKRVRGINQSSTIRISYTFSL